MLISGIYKFSLLGVVIATTAINTIDNSRDQLNVQFSLRQSFHHNLSSSNQPPEFFHHALPQFAASLQTTIRPNPALILKWQPATKISHLKRASQNRWQHFISSMMPSSNKSDVRQPNVTDKATVVNLAKMTSDAYYNDPNLPEWLNLTDGFNRSQSFGWEKDGLRGHVFANADNSTVVIAFKGTNTYPLDKTRGRDRENDNVLFSCCCATQRKDPYWYGSVCDCRTSTYSCNSTCLAGECGRDDRYYAKAKEVVLNITASYPDSQLWLVGHSLGGAMASLMGMTFHAPAVTFESPPERLPAQRLGLDMTSDDYLPAHHFGHTSDPIYQGACNGFSASCSITGYAFESQCHTGQRCVYDTGADKGWRLSIVNHGIKTVINNVLEQYDTVPECAVDECEGDCFNWSFSK